MNYLNQIWRLNRRTKILSILKHSVGFEKNFQIIISYIRGTLMYHKHHWLHIMILKISIHQEHQHTSHSDTIRNIEHQRPQKTTSTQKSLIYLSNRSHTNLSQLKNDHSTREMRTTHIHQLSHWQPKQNRIREPSVLN